MPHPKPTGSAGSSVALGFSGSGMLRTGSAATTAVAETDVSASWAPTGKARGALTEAFGFAFAPRLMGANASAADHPECRWVQSNNKKSWTGSHLIQCYHARRTVDRIPAVDFPADASCSVNVPSVALGTLFVVKAATEPEAAFSGTSTFFSSS